MKIIYVNLCSSTMYYNLIVYFIFALYWNLELEFKKKAFKIIIISLMLVKVVYLVIMLNFLNFKLNNN